MCELALEIDDAVFDSCSVTEIPREKTPACTLTQADALRTARRPEAGTDPVAGCDFCIRGTMCRTMLFLFPYSVPELACVSLLANALDIPVSAIQRATTRLSLDGLVELGSDADEPAALGARLTHRGREYLLERCLVCGHLNQ